MTYARKKDTPPIAKIRALLAAGMTKVQLGLRFGVTPLTITRWLKL